MRNRHRRFFLAAVASSVMLATVPAGAAETFPAKPITIVVPFAAGSGTDEQARTLAKAITDAHQVSVVVDNRGGASGMIAAQYVANAQPDGYTIMLTTNTTQSANPHLYKKLPYDPVKDLQPLSLVSRGSMYLIVEAASPFKSVADLLAAAKQSPGTLNFGSGSSSSRVAGELLLQMTGADVVHVPYKSNPQALTDLIGQQIDYMYIDSSSALPALQAGRVRALAVSGPARIPVAPDVPTMAEAGVPGFEVTYWTAVYAPAGTPGPIVDKLHEMVVGAALSEPMKVRQANVGSESVTSTPAELAAFQQAESDKWGKVIREAGIIPE